MDKGLKIRLPYFSVNTKSYMYGKEALNLAKEVDKLAEKYDVDVFFTCQAVDIPLIAQNTKNLIVTAQRMDGIKPGPGMGKVLPEALKEAGARAVNLNHAENPMSLFELTKAQKRADELGLFTIMCGSSIEDCKALAQLNPNVVVCEKTELIGGGQIADLDYMHLSKKAVKEVNPDIIVVQAAGISTPDDVRFVLEAGSEGTGAASGIMKAENPIQLIDDMLAVIKEFRDKSGDVK